MKKTIIAIAMMMGMVSMANAGQKVVVVPAPLPEPQAIVQPLSVELGMGYNWAMTKQLSTSPYGKKNHMKSMSWDVTGVYDLDDTSALTLRFSYSYGRDKFNTGFEEQIDGVTYHARETQHEFALMPGYRLNCQMTESVTVFAGANVGLANVSYKLDDYVQSPLGRDRVSVHDSAWGLGYSAELGVKYQLTESTDVFTAFTVTGNTAKTKTQWDGDTITKGTRPCYIGVRAGVDVRF